MFLPEHLSYSAVSMFETCPRSWYLKYARKGVETPTWFFPMGTVVHQSIESYLETGDVPKFEDLFYPIIRKQRLVEPDVTKWLHAGSKQDPVMKAKAVELGKICVENAIKFLEDMDVYKVEYDASGILPGCEVPIKAFVDIYGEHKKHGNVIVDWKSGKRKPKGYFQLETYAALWPDPVNMGLWAMLHPDAAKARPYDLSSVDPAEVGARYQRAYEGMKKKIYAAKPPSAMACDFCTMKPNCQYASGPSKRAKFYDLADKEGYPF